MGQKKNNTTKIIVGILVVVLIAIVAVTATVFVRGKMKADDYTASIASAENFWDHADYEQAIVQYRNAIALNPDKAEPYLALADIYLEQNDISKAKSILRKGYEETGSARIQGKLDSIENSLTSKVEGDGEIDASVVDLDAASPNITWDTSFEQKLINYTFDDYKANYGAVVSAEMDADGYLEVRHENLSAVCYYQNTDDNPNIVDVTRKTPYDTSMPAKISLDSLSLLFRNFDGAASLNRMQMLFGERVTPNTLEGRPYIMCQKEYMISRIGTDPNGNIVSPAAWNEIILLTANQKRSQANMSGVVIDAVTGAGVEDATLSFKPFSASNPTVEVVTDSSGAFEATLAPDDYEITISATGYTEETFDFTIRSGEIYSGEQFVISPVVTNEARIVLSWNAQPTDLDSHLTGTTDGGRSVHVFYADPSADGVADLDLDDRNGYGPETTTIHDLNGTYTFTVEDFLSTGTMGANGASVKVYLPGQSPVEITLNGGSGNTWTVCTIEHGQLNIINSMG